jgi:hypothetical protein
MTTKLEDKVLLYRMDLDDVALEALLQECESLSHDSCDNIWVDILQLERSSSRYLVENIVAHLYAEVMKGNLDDGIVGAEFWVQVSYRCPSTISRVQSNSTQACQHS